MRSFTQNSGASIVSVVAIALMSSSLAAAKEPDGAARYTPPRLSGGAPDFQGNWEHTNCTPLERPASVDALFITPQQARQIERSLEVVAEDRGTPTEPTEFFNLRSIQAVHGQLRSSIIVEPANGKLPGTPLFTEWQAKARAGVLNAMDGPEQRPTSERCLGNPVAQAPHLYNPGTNLLQIIQTPEFVVIKAEFIGETRVIRLNSKHRPAAITTWAGDSIGWWEGQTLVVETKFFSPNDGGRVAAGNFYKVSSDATVVERFARLTPKELYYEFTVTDPAYYSQPWKGQTHFLRTSDELLEYACHEANDSLTYILRGARVKDGTWREN